MPVRKPDLQPHQTLLVGAILIGLLVRIIPVASSAFPLHDGGLLYAMIGDLRSNSFLLPAFTSYNSGDIPFAYPPLSLYIGAGLNAFGADRLWILQWVPLFFSLASVPLVYLVVRELLSSAHAAAAALAFALMPSAFDWMILGGGLTRALGLAFALLTIHETLKVARGRARWHGVAAGIAGGLTVLTHPYAGAFAFVTGALFVLWWARSSRAWINVAITVGCSIVVVSPWIGTVVAIHGWQPILAAGSSRTQGGVPLASLLFQDVTGAAFSVFLGFGLLGVATQFARRDYVLPIWLFLTVLLVGGGGWVMTTIPIAALISVAFVDVVVPALSRLHVGERGHIRAAAVFLTAGLIASLGVGYSIPTPLHPLPVGDRDAMAWIAEHVDPAASVAVITGEPWALDTASEWFPVLADHVSVATAQGYEWTPEWDQRKAEAEGLQACASIGTVRCVEDWVAVTHRTPDYIYVEKSQPQALAGSECCPQLRDALADVLETPYDGPGATIFVWRQPGQPSARSVSRSAAPTDTRVTS
jgi:hypothetical protein